MGTLNTSNGLDALLQRHQALATVIQSTETWVSPNEVADNIPVVTREFSGALYLPPGAQQGLTQININHSVMCLVVPKAASALCQELLGDLAAYEERTNSRVSGEELLNAMGLESLPRLKDLNLGTLGANPKIAQSQARPCKFANGPEEHGLGYVVRSLTINNALRAS